MASAIIIFEKRNVFNVVQIDLVKFFESTTESLDCRLYIKIYDLLKTYRFLDQ